MNISAVAPALSRQSFTRMTCISLRNRVMCESASNGHAYHKSLAHASFSLPPSLSKARTRSSSSCSTEAQPLHTKHAIRIALRMTLHLLLTQVILHDERQTLKLLDQHSSAPNQTHANIDVNVVKLIIRYGASECDQLPGDLYCRGVLRVVFVSVF